MPINDKTVKALINSTAGGRASGESPKYAEDSQLVLREVFSTFSKRANILEVEFSDSDENEGMKFKGSLKKLRRNN